MLPRIWPIFHPITDLDLITDLTFCLIASGFHRIFAMGAACQQRTLTPPDTRSCPVPEFDQFLTLLLIWTLWTWTLNLSCFWTFEFRTSLGTSVFLLWITCFISGLNLESMELLPFQRQGQSHFGLAYASNFEINFPKPCCDFHYFWHCISPVHFRLCFEMYSIKPCNEGYSMCGMLSRRPLTYHVYHFESHVKFYVG